jgi:hypothetical protein
MDRRTFLFAAVPACLFWGTGAPEAADGIAFADLLHQIEQDPTITEDAWLFENRSASRGVGQGRAPGLAKDHTRE